MCSLLVDAGLDRVGYYISRYVPPIRQFRFMDLPVELRNIVARYALTADEPLEFKWLLYTPTKKIGTFEKLDQLTALNRVSKSLRRETMDLVWRLNDVSFKYNLAMGSHIDPSFWRYHEIGAIKEAMGVVFHNLSPISLPPISIQLLCRTLGGEPQLLTAIEDLVTSYSLPEPKAVWKVFDISWTFSCSQAGFPTTYAIFAEQAKTLRQALARFDATTQLRRWRLFPVTNPGPEEALRHLVAAGLPDAQVWIQDGL